MEDWTANSKFSNVSVTSGSFKGTTLGNAAALISPNLGFAGSNLPVAHIKLKTSVNAYLQFQWQTSVAPAFGPERSVKIAANAKDAFKWISIPLGENSEWTDKKITKIQVIPCLATGATVEIDEIVISDGDRDDDGIGDGTEGYGDSDGDGIVNFLDTD